MAAGGSKETRTVLLLVIIQVLGAPLHFYFRILVSCKVAFEERTCKIIVNKLGSFLLNLKLDFNIQKVLSRHQRCSIKKVVLKNFVKFAGKHLYRNLFLYDTLGDCFWVFPHLLSSCFPNFS